MKTAFLLLTSQEALLPRGVDSKASGRGVHSLAGCSREPLPTTSEHQSQPSSFRLQPRHGPHSPPSLRDTPDPSSGSWPMSNQSCRSCLSSVSGVRSSSLSTLHGFTWGTEYLSCTCTATAPPYSLTSPGPSRAAAAGHLPQAEPIPSPSCLRTCPLLMVASLRFMPHAGSPAIPGH